MSARRLKICWRGLSEIEGIINHRGHRGKAKEGKRKNRKRKRILTVLPVLSSSVSSVVNDLMNKVGFISLGCPKNLVDSEVMMGQLKQKGFQITADAEDADTVVVNTCGFIESAKKESIEAILEAARLKTDGKAKRLVVAGCLV